MVVQPVLIQRLKSPTAMGFIAPNDILVLEKNEWPVQRIVNGKMLQEPLLHVVVSKMKEVCWELLLQRDYSLEPELEPPTYVFLYFTEAGQQR